MKLVDFGLAYLGTSLCDEEFSLAMIFGHDCLGTPDYMPPEQADDSLSATQRSDVYALGGTLFAAVSRVAAVPGRHPGGDDPGASRPAGAVDHGSGPSNRCRRKPKRSSSG